LNHHLHPHHHSFCLGYSNYHLREVIVTLVVAIVALVDVVITLAVVLVVIPTTVLVVDYQKKVAIVQQLLVIIVGLMLNWLRSIIAFLLRPHHLSQTNNLLQILHFCHKQNKLRLPYALRIPIVSTY
jgi:hypothetical protein